jgi:hypothetical protein
MEGKAQEAEDASTRQIAEARKGVMSNLPQATQAVTGQRIEGLGGREKTIDYEVSAAKPLQRAEVFKKYAEMMEVPGMEKTATAYLNSAQSEIQREDLQVEAQRKQKDDIERRREEAERHSNDLARSDWARSQAKADELEYKRERDRQDAQLRRELAAIKAGGDGKAPTETSAQAKERQTNEQNVNSAMARENALRGAKELVEKSTGSTPGRVRDWVAGKFDVSTEGSEAIADLKALEGRLLANTPKFTGPTSDRDVIVYQQAVGRLADPSTPTGDRLSALKQVRLMSRDDYNQATRMAGNFNKRAVSPDHTVDVPEFKLEPLDEPVGKRGSSGKVTALPQAVAAKAPGAVAGGGQVAAPVPVGKPAADGATQVIGGTKYVKRGGQWFQE